MNTPIRARSKEHLRMLILQAMKEQGQRCALNHIDVSGVDDMSSLFSDSLFNGDISQWDVSNVVDMTAMFSGSTFNGDISRWNTSNVISMRYMFYKSAFQGDLSAWSYEALEDKDYMFTNFHSSPFGLDFHGWVTNDQGYPELEYRDPAIEPLLEWTKDIESLQEQMSTRWQVYQDYLRFANNELADHPVHALCDTPLEKAWLSHQMKGQLPIMVLSELSDVPIGTFFSS